MTNEKMLEKVSSLVNYLDENEKKLVYTVANDAKTWTVESNIVTLGELIKELRSDIAKDEAKKSGRTKQLSAAKKIVKRAEKTSKESLKYAVIQNEKQCLCDNHMAVRLKNPIVGLPALPEKLEYINLDSFVKMPDNAVELELPDMNKLSAYIKIWKAEHNKKEACLFDFGEQKPLIQAEYLFDIMTLIPDASAYVKDGSAISMIYFENASGDDGALMPYNPKGIERKKTEL